MTAGVYTIRVTKELMLFETVTVKIAPNTPQLPDIITAGYVCCFLNQTNTNRKWLVSLRSLVAS